MSARSTCAVVAALLVAPAFAQPEDSTPLTSGLEERVEVRLVLLDVVVTDRSGDPVSGLEAEEFDVRIGRDRVSLVSFDAFCTPVDAPAAVEPALTGSPGSGIAPGRIVLAFDYDHIPNAAVAIEHARRALDETPAGVPHMVVSIGERLRVEQGFEPDPARTLATLERMFRDPTLWAAYRGRLTEKRFFERVLTLFDLLEQDPGRSTVVLFSGPFADDGFTYDTILGRIAARAARTRTAFYTVDAGGMRTLLDPDASGMGGPPMLRRIAHATGGRPTADTNDLSLAYRRAARALDCSYTLGFHDPRPALDRRRRVRVDVWRPGHRVAHPASYLERSDRARRQSLADAALVAPELFAHDGLQVATRVVERGSRRRRVEISAAFARPPAADGSRVVRAHVLNAQGTVIRRVRLAPDPDDDADAWRARGGVGLRPGSYELRVVMSDAQLDAPLATGRWFSVPEPSISPRPAPAAP